jgi:hypothetical protein
MSDISRLRYPLLQEYLDLRGIQLQPAYRNREVAVIFDVTIRTIQAHIQRGDLVPRDLPGGRRFLPSDLEEYLINSRRKGR